MSKQRVTVEIQRTKNVFTGKNDRRCVLRFVKVAQEEEYESRITTFVCLARNWTETDQDLIDHTVGCFHKWLRDAIEIKPERIEYEQQETK